MSQPGQQIKRPYVRKIIKHRDPIVRMLFERALHAHISTTIPSGMVEARWCKLVETALFCQHVGYNKLTDCDKTKLVRPMKYILEKTQGVKLSELKSNSDKLTQLYEELKETLVELIEVTNNYLDIVEKEAKGAQSSQIGHRHRVAKVCNDIMKRVNGTHIMAQNSFDENIHHQMATAKIVTAEDAHDDIVDLVFKSLIGHKQLVIKTKTDKDDVEIFRSVLLSYNGLSQQTTMTWGERYFTSTIGKPEWAGTKHGTKAQIAEDMPLLEAMSQKKSLLNVLRELGSHTKFSLQAVVNEPRNNKGQLKFPLPTITKAIKDTGLHDALDDDGITKIAVRIVLYYIYYRQTTSKVNYQLQASDIGKAGDLSEKKDREIAQLKNDKAQLEKKITGMAKVAKDDVATAKAATEAAEKAAADAQAEATTLKAELDIVKRTNALLQKELDEMKAALQASKDECAALQVEVNNVGAAKDAGEAKINELIAEKTATDEELKECQVSLRVTESKWVQGETTIQDLKSESTKLTNKLEEIKKYINNTPMGTTTRSTQQQEAWKQTLLTKF